MISKLDLYRVFWQVGKDKSFSKAAKNTYMTQPAVSQSILQLERELDIRLFNRTSKGVTLTSEGSILFEYINSAMNLINTSEEKLLEFKNLTAGELKIGVGDTISRYFLLPYLEEFHNKYPNIKFKMSNNTTLELCSILKSGEIDIVICNFPINDPTLELISCIDIHDIFVCGEKYNRMFSEPLTLREIADLPLILLENKSNSRKYLDQYMLSKGVKFSPEFELGSYDLLLEFARINLGIACVTKEFSQEYLEKGILYELKTTEKIPKRNIGICYLKSVPLSLASKKFIEIIQNNKM